MHNWCPQARHWILSLAVVDVGYAPGFIFEGFLVSAFSFTQSLAVWNYPLIADDDILLLGQETTLVPNCLIYMIWTLLCAPQSSTTCVVLKCTVTALSDAFDTKLIFSPDDYNSRNSSWPDCQCTILNINTSGSCNPFSFPCISGPINLVSFHGTKKVEHVVQSLLNAWFFCCAVSNCKPCGLSFLNTKS